MHTPVNPSTPAQRAHEEALAKKNQELMLEQMERGRYLPNPAQEKREKAFAKKSMTTCMNKVNIPKCVIDGVWAEEKHQDEMQLKRNAYIEKYHPPRPLYNALPLKGGMQIYGQLQHQQTSRPDWSEINRMFPNYKKTKCHQKYLDEEQIRLLRNQQEYRDRVGDDFPNRLYGRKLDYANMAANQGPMRERAVFSKEIAQRNGLNRISCERNWALYA